MSTLLLDTELWDLTVDVAGNIAVADAPYALAQDAASAIRLFLGELWFDTTQGVPYRELFLGKTAALPLLKAKLVAAALTVPGVVSARCFVRSIENRTVSGQVQVTDRSGLTSAAEF